MFNKLLCLLSLYLPVYYFCNIYKPNNTKRTIWDTFTRVISTINAIDCINMTFHSLLNWDNYFDLHFTANEYQIDMLFWFCSYLFIDGIFQIPDIFKSFNLNLFSSIIHHFVGGFGIYLIANTKMGFFLGFYFSMTEISTPFLNLSWFIKNKYLFLTFYGLFMISRILTSPLLLIYLRINEEKIIELVPLQYFMVYYATLTLILLNFVWFLFLTKKLLKYWNFLDLIRNKIFKK